MKLCTITLLLILTAFSEIYTQDLWEKTTALDTVTTFSLAINSNGDIFAGTHMAGVFRSTDNGNTWTNLGIMNFDISSMVISSTGKILIGTTQGADGGVYGSTNNGTSWDSLGLSEHPEISIAINNSNGYIFVGTAAVGVYRSTDDGANWTQLNQGLDTTDGLNVNTLAINSGGHVFAGTISGGIFRSTNNGDNWVQTSADSLYVLSLAINSSGNIFAGTSGSGLFRSTDNGVNWVQINQGIAGQGLYIYSLAIDSSGNIFAGTDDGIFYSTDNGANWIQINQGLTNKYAHSLAINSGGDVFAGTEGGIFRSNSSANIKIFLQGPYASGSMSTALRDNGYVPLVQPYNAAPWNYSGVEAVDTVPAGVVDWVLVELRSDLTTQVTRRAAFLKSDGSLVDLDGVSNVKFPAVAAGEYYVVIRHRNHLAVMTANKVSISLSPALYDMSTDQGNSYGTNAMRDLGGGFYGMYTADTDGSGTVNASDRSNTWNQRNLSGYYGTDVDLSGTVNAADRSAAWNNRNISTQVP